MFRAERKATRKRWMKTAPKKMDHNGKLKRWKTLRSRQRYESMREKSIVAGASRKQPSFKCASQVASDYSNCSYTPRSYVECRVCV